VQTFDTGKIILSSETNSSPNEFSGAIAYEDATTAGSNDASCNWGKDNVDWSHAVMEVKAKLTNLSITDTPTVRDSAVLVRTGSPDTDPPDSTNQSGSSGGKVGGGGGGGFTMAPNLVLYDSCSDVNKVRVIASTYGDNLSAIINVDEQSSAIKTTDVTEKINPYAYIDLQIRTPIKFYTFDAQLPDDVNSFTIKIYDKSKKESLYYIELMDGACSLGKVISQPKGATMIVPEMPYFIIYDPEPIPECEVDEILVGDQCVLPEPVPECEVDEILVDGVCILPEPVPECEVDEILVDGVCILPEPVPECEVDEILVDGVCILPEPVPECEEGTHAENGICILDEGLRGGGCLIATATFGSELAPQVQQLRELRDNILLQTDSGSVFMGEFNQIYYWFSPTIADWERQNPAFKEAVKLFITPMISSFSILTLADSGSEFELLGLLVITLNIGLYIVAPATFAYKVYRRYGYRKQKNSEVEIEFLA
jgi:hypothetical protein